MGLQESSMRYLYALQPDESCVQSLYCLLRTSFPAKLAVDSIMGGLLM